MLIARLGARVATVGHFVVENELRKGHRQKGFDDTNARVVETATR